MKKHFFTILISLSVCAALSACSLYNKEIVYMEDYTSQYQPASADESSIIIEEPDDISDAISNLIYSGSTEGTLIFNSDYEGNPNDDISSACWLLSKSDALCSYCVDRITYDTNKVISSYEANIYINYFENASGVEDIVRLNFSSSMQQYISRAVSELKTYLVILVQNSFYTQSDVEEIINNIYLTSPLCSPKEIKSEITVYSGSGKQRLYEIRFDYGVDEAEMTEFKEFSENAEFGSICESSKSKEESVYRLLEYLKGTVTVAADSKHSSAYSALYEKCADSKGVSLGLVYLLKFNSIDARLVTGQYNRSDYYWVIVHFNGNYYHVNPYAFLSEAENTEFLLGDREMWEAGYRWDMNSYPSCNEKSDYSAEDFYVEPVNNEE